MNKDQQQSKDLKIQTRHIVHCKNKKHKNKQSSVQNPSNIEFYLNPF